jgi:hypothetical protein
VEQVALDSEVVLITLAEQAEMEPAEQQIQVVAVEVPAASEVLALTEVQVTLLTRATKAVVAVVVLAAH